MKRRRRVEIHIEHREISVFAGPGFVSGQPGAAARQESTALERIRSAACPVCGSADLLLLAEAVAVNGLDVPALQTGVENGRFHLHCSGSGEWWICRQSIHHR